MPVARRLKTPAASSSAPSPPAAASTTSSSSIATAIPIRRRASRCCIATVRCSRATRRWNPRSARCCRASTDLLATVEAGGAVPLRTTSPLDGVERFGVLRLVPDYPLAVVVSRDADVALAPWRAQAYGGALRTLALAASRRAAAGSRPAPVRRDSSRRARRSRPRSERFAAAVAGSDDGIWDWDLQAGTAYESRRARELHGLPLEPETQPIGVLKSLRTSIPTMRLAAPRRCRRISAGDTPAYEAEYRVRQATASYRWIHVRAVCIRDAERQAGALAGSVSDIDARKRAEEALRAERGALRAGDDRLQRRPLGVGHPENSSTFMSESLARAVRHPGAARMRRRRRRTSPRDAVHPTTARACDRMPQRAHRRPHVARRPRVPHRGPRQRLAALDPRRARRRSPTPSGKVVRVAGVTVDTTDAQAHRGRAARAARSASHWRSPAPTTASGSGTSATPWRSNRPARASCTACRRTRAATAA